MDAAAPLPDPPHADNDADAGVVVAAHIDDHEALRRLVHRARMLVQAEREGGIVELPGTPAPPAEQAALPREPGRSAPRGGGTPIAAAAPPAAPSPIECAPGRRAAAADRVHPPAGAAPTAPPTAVPVPTDFVPRVRVLDLPPDALAPFGDLPAAVAACRLCALCESRTTPVFGEGSPGARLVFCGEAPGFEEDRSGRPFVGAAGELLTAMIEKGLKLRREDVFILNAIKCRPPANRTPLPDEIAACRPHLEQQLKTIRPKVIVALGNPACRALLGPILGTVPGIMTIRGKEFEGYGAKIVPTFHPAYLLRNPEAKRDTWSDLQLVTRLLEASLLAEGLRDGLRAEGPPGA